MRIVDDWWAGPVVLDRDGLHRLVDAISKVSRRGEVHQDTVAKLLVRLLGAVVSETRVGGKRPRIRTIPDVMTARKSFEAAHGGNAIEWGD